MKYYSEEDMRDSRLKLEKRILRWANVSTKKMFGCPCYKADGKLFAFLVTNGVVITKLDQNQRETLSRRYDVSSFQAGKKIVRNWTRLSMNHKGELEEIIPYIRKSYESVLREN